MIDMAHSKYLLGLIEGICKSVQNVLFRNCATCAPPSWGYFTSIKSCQVRVRDVYKMHRIFRQPRREDMIEMAHSNRFFELIEGICKSAQNVQFRNCATCAPPSWGYFTSNKSCQVRVRDVYKMQRIFRRPRKEDMIEMAHSNRFLELKEGN